MRRFPNLFLALVMMIALSTAWAQTGAADRSSAAGKKGTNAAQRSAEQSAPSPQETHASNEAAGRPKEAEAVRGNEKAADADQNAEFKQSAPVRLLARITGLSLTGAYWLAVAINFAIVVVLIVLGLKSSLPKAFRARTEEIQKAMLEARRASEEAGRRLSNIEERLARLDTSITGMRAQAEAELKADEQRIWAAAEEEKHKIVEAAEQEIASAANAARRELKVLAVELATALAERQMKVDPGQDKQLVQDFAEQLENRGSTDGRR